jgi:hypothetical protein
MNGHTAQAVVKPYFCRLESLAFSAGLALQSSNRSATLPASDGRLSGFYAPDKTIGTITSTRNAAL